MKQFIRLYGWGTNLKLHMAIYAVALIITDCLVQWLMGVRALPILTLVEIIAVALVVAVLEAIIFPQDGDWEGGAMARRTALWALMCNLCFIGASVAFGWFAGIPVWAAALLAVYLECGLAAMWFAMHVALKRDTRRLNRGLQAYKNEK